MAKEKSPFEKTAAALKVMGKKIAAKKNEPRRELQCVWIANHSGHAVATDGHVLACLDLNHWGNFDRPEMLPELAFYADMQVIHYTNGDALISAGKKGRIYQGIRSRHDRNPGLRRTRRYDNPLSRLEGPCTVRRKLAARFKNWGSVLPGTVGCSRLGAGCLRCDIR